MGVFFNETGVFFLVKDGMGRLRITKNGIILEGPAEFIKTVKAKYIMSRVVCSVSFLALYHWNQSFIEVI